MKKIIVLFSVLTFICLNAQPQWAGERTSSVVHPVWSLGSTIYEVNIRQYTPEGTFKALEKHLPRLQKMGVDILWLMPVNPIGKKNRKGSLGSYYSIQNYLEINPEFGTKEDFKNFVRKAHDLGMKVIIDWVANHTSWDNPLIVEHPEWYKKDSTGSIVPPVPDWTDVAALDYSNEGLRKYMTGALAYWIKETDIDGYRCDVAGMLPIGFWNEAVPQLQQIKPVFMLAEDDHPEMHDTAFDATYSWNLFHLMNEIAKGEKPAYMVPILMESEKTQYPPDAFRMRFTSNHDENSWNGTEYERLGQGAQAFAVLAFTCPGIPLIYSGQEAGLIKRLRFFDKDTIPWEKFPLEEFYTRLIKLKKNNKALSNGIAGAETTWISKGNDPEVLAYIRHKGKQKVFVVLNLSESNQTLEPDGDGFTGKYTELFSGQKKEWKPGEIYHLKPWQYQVFVSE